MTNTQELKPQDYQAALDDFERTGCPRIRDNKVYKAALRLAITRAAEAVPTVDVMLSEEVIVSRLDAAIAYYDGRKMPKQVSDTAVYHLNNLFYAAKAHRASLAKPMVDVGVMKPETPYEFAKGIIVMFKRAFDPPMTVIKCEFLADIIAKRDASLAAPKVPGWQPIESAPKDGTQILGLEKMGRVLVMNWHVDEYGYNADIYACLSSRFDYYPTSGLTHWMPLPSAPSQSANAGV